MQKWCCPEEFCCVNVLGRSAMQRCCGLWCCFKREYKGKRDLTWLDFDLRTRQFELTTAKQTRTSPKEGNEQWWQPTTTIYHLISSYRIPRVPGKVNWTCIVRSTLISPIRLYLLHVAESNATLLLPSRWKCWNTGPPELVWELVSGIMELWSLWLGDGELVIGAALLEDKEKSEDTSAN